MLARDCYFLPLDLEACLWLCSKFKWYSILELRMRTNVWCATEAANLMGVVNESGSMPVPFLRARHCSLGVVWRHGRGERGGIAASGVIPCSIVQVLPRGSPGLYT